MPHISSFPSELLFEIFTNVVFDPLDPANPIPMKQSLTKIYSSLHNLLAVCSVWRDVALSRPQLWSIVPIVAPERLGFSGSGRPISPDLSLQRSGSIDLHLAAIASAEPQIGTDLTKHAPRFRSINIFSESHSAIGSIMRKMLRSDSPLQVSDLSICLHGHFHSTLFPRHRYYLFSPGTSKQKEFESITTSLSVLRISGVLIHWDRVVFSHRLVELELHNVTLGYDSKLGELMSSLSSATELRSLKVISIQTISDPATAQNTNAAPSVLFPKLQTLLARNLYFNTLNSLLSPIASRSHLLTLHLTKRTFDSIQPGRGEPQESPSEDVLNLFRRVTVYDLLLVMYEDERSWLSAADIKEILHSMPDLKTLRMHGWDYYTKFCEAIQQPGTPGFPELQRIYLSGAWIRDEEAFKDMVASYSKSLEHMELAGSVIQGSGRPHFDDFLEGGEKIVTWLKRFVPSFKLTSNYDTPLEFSAYVWQLW